MKHKLIITSVAMAAIVLVSLCAVGASALSVSAAQGSNSNAQAPGLVGASIQGAPAVCSQDGVTLDLFVRGTNSHLYWLHSPDGTTWTPSTAVDLGGYCTSNPAATSPALGTIDVFVRGGDGALWKMNVTNAGGMTPITVWSKIGGQLLTSTGPAAYSFGGATGTVGWFVTGANHALYQQSSVNGASPSSWKNLGGYLTSAPAAATLPSGEIGVIVAGTNSIIYYEHFTGTTWDPWVKVGGQLLTGTSPAAYSWTTGPRIGWFVTGTNSQLYHSWSGPGSSGWQNLGGVLTSSPGSTSKAGTIIDVFARGSGGGMAALWQRDYNHVVSGDWTVWTFVGQVGP